MSVVASRDVYIYSAVVMITIYSERVMRAILCPCSVNVVRSAD